MIALNVALRSKNFKFFNKNNNHVQSLKLVLTSLVFTPRPGKESKRPTASPDGVMTNENMLREYMASLEAKEDAKKDLNNTSTFANQVQ